MTSAGSFSVNMAQPSAAASRNAAWPLLGRRSSPVMTAVLEARK